MPIKVTFIKRNPGGRSQTVIDAIGYTGQSCQAATERLRQMLGAAVEETLKPEFEEGEQVHETEASG